MMDQVIYHDIEKEISEYNNLHKQLIQELVKLKERVALLEDKLNNTDTYMSRLSKMYNNINRYIYGYNRTNVINSIPDLPTK